MPFNPGKKYVRKFQAVIEFTTYSDNPKRPKSLDLEKMLGETFDRFVEENQDYVDFATTMKLLLLGRVRKSRRIK